MSDCFLRSLVPPASISATSRRPSLISLLSVRHTTSIEPCQVRKVEFEAEKVSGRSQALRWFGQAYSWRRGRRGICQGARLTERSRQRARRITPLDVGSTGIIAALLGNLASPEPLPAQPFRTTRLEAERVLRLLVRGTAERRIRDLALFIWRSTASCADAIWWRSA